MIDLLSEEEYEARNKNPQRPYNNAWEVAMNIKGDKTVPTRKMVFFIDGKEASEEELKIFRQMKYVEYHVLRAGRAKLRSVLKRKEIRISGY